MNTPISDQVAAQAVTEHLHAEANRLAQMLADFDDTLQLQYIPEQLLSNKKPFRIVQDAPGHKPYTVMHLSAEELDYRVIARLAEARDFGRNGKVSLNDHLAYEEAAYQVQQAKKQQEFREEQMDKSKFLIRTPLHTVNFEGKKLHL